MRVGRVMLAALVLGCGGGDGELRVAENRAEGALGHVRCLAVPVGARAWSVGSLRLQIDEERRLTIEGAPSAARVAAFSGPVDRASVQALRRERVQLALVLGELGGSRAELDASLAALAELGAPALVVAGGADRHELLRAAFAALEGDARDRVVDASGLRAVRMGATELVLLAGAPDGRYADSDGSCGFGEADVAALAEALGAPAEGVRRTLASWAGPERAVGLAGVPAGSSLVSRLVERAGARGVVYAWPREQAGDAQPDPLRVVVRPLSGQAVVRGDGARMRPGATVLMLGRDGLSLPQDSP